MESKNELSENTVKREKYSWGDIVVVSKGNKYKAVIHPENMETIERVYASGEPNSFKDEQKVVWKLTPTEDGVQLKSGSKVLVINKKDIK